jgi:hypothetical protein
MTPSTSRASLVEIHIHSRRFPYALRPPQ